MKQSNSSSLERSFILFLGIMILGTILLGQLTQSPDDIWAPAITTHQSSVPPIWTKQNVYIGDYEQHKMIAVAGKLVIIGSERQESLSSLLAFDGASGNVFWENSNISANVVTTSSSMLFIGGVGNVIAINPTDGKIIWSTHLPSRSVTKLLVRDELLHADTVSGNHFLLDPETGTIIQSIEYTIDNAPNEDIPPLSNHRMNLDYVGNILFFQKQIGWPFVKEVEIIATEETSGTQLWSSTLPIVGRAACSQLGIFALQTDGKVLHLNPISGISSKIVQFDPALTKQYQYEDGAYQAYGYFVTVDNVSQTMFVYLGDSRQLFAFRLPVSYE